LTRCPARIRTSSDPGADAGIESLPAAADRLVQTGALQSAMAPVQVTTAKTPIPMRRAAGLVGTSAAGAGATIDSIASAFESAESSASTVGGAGGALAALARNCGAYWPGGM